MNVDSSLLILDILDILQKYTNEDNWLIKKDLIDILENEYDYDRLNRHTVTRTFDKLRYHRERRGLNQIRPKTIIYRSTGDIESDFVYEHTFKEQELHLIIDSILFSKHIPSFEKNDLIQKLEGLSSKHFNSRSGYIPATSNNTLMNTQLLDTIETLLKAMNQNKKVSFYYNDYLVDEGGNLHLGHRKDDKGNAREYIINAYELVEANGRYYLICNYDKYDGLSNYRVDRISDITILNDQRKSIKDMEGFQHGLDLAKYMKEHIYLFSGDTERVKMRLARIILNDFIDWFGTDDIDFYEMTKEDLVVSVLVNRAAMRKWALQYALYVTVLSPSELVEDIKKDLQTGLDRYN